MKAYVVDSAAVRSNLQQLQTRAGSAVLWAVLKGDGYGLGLYVVKTILNQHKEQITVTSENGVTAFSFTVQMADTARNYGEEQEK